MEKKTIEDFIHDGKIITALTTRIFFALKAANIKPPKRPLDAMDIIKLTSGICVCVCVCVGGGGVLVEDYAVKLCNAKYR